jgi:hypothetical protein
MSQQVGETLPQASARHDPIRALLRAGNNDKSNRPIVPDHRPPTLTISSTKNCCLMLFIKNAIGYPRLLSPRKLVHRQPDIPRLQKALIATLSNMKRYDETIVQASQYIERHGQDLTMLDALKVAYFCTGKADEAIRYGQRAIELRDAEACRNPLPFAMTEPSGPPSGHNVISFSLWGSAPFYSYGAMINPVLSRTIYPG